MSKGIRSIPTIEAKVFSGVGEIDRAISKIQLRLKEVRELAQNSVNHNDPRVRSAAKNIESSILEIYGPNSPEFAEFRGYEIHYGGYSIGMTDAEWQKRFADGIPHTIEALENLCRRLEEKKADLSGDDSTRIRAAFFDLQLHPRIGGVAIDLYRDGHYRNAVLDAALALTAYVKEKSRRHDLDGASLMREVFSKNNPILAFNGLTNKTDEDEQEGLMHMFEGVTLALRNPRAHALSDDSPETALEYVALISLLAKKLDQAKRTSA